MCVVIVCVYVFYVCFGIEEFLFYGDVFIWKKCVNFVFYILLIIFKYICIFYMYWVVLMLGCGYWVSGGWGVLIGYYLNINICFLKILGKRGLFVVLMREREDDGGSVG